MKKVFFVRHGQAEHNLPPIFGGHKDWKLTEKGKEQAKEAAENVAALGEDIKLIIASPLSRAHDTAKIIAERIKYPLEKIEIDHRITERHDGKMSGVSDDDESRKAITKHMLNPKNEMGVESVNTQMDRIGRFYADLKKKEHEVILVVGHNGVGRMIRRVAAGHEPTKPLKKLDNAEVMQLVPYVEVEGDREEVL